MKKKPNYFQPLPRYGHVNLRCHHKRYICIFQLFFLRHFKYISVVFFASVIDQIPSTSLICKNEKKNRISIRKYAQKLRAGGILDSHDITWVAQVGMHSVIVPSRDEVGFYAGVLSSMDASNLTKTAMDLFWMLYCLM